ncbi:hypothetical protein [Profundibacter sp.]|uniref:hypothetical protein n=1 Tax=Profundibacter sp. TaxID=3101071 RepID=UPI003D0B5044
MKRIFTLATIALTTLASSAFAMAPTDAEMALINRYAPLADVHMLSDAQFSKLMNIINSNDSEGSKRLRAGLATQSTHGLSLN